MKLAPRQIIGMSAIAACIMFVWFFGGYLIHRQNFLISLISSAAIAVITFVVGLLICWIAFSDHTSRRR